MRAVGLRQVGPRRRPRPDLPDGTFAPLKGRVPDELLVVGVSYRYVSHVPPSCPSGTDLSPCAHGVITVLKRVDSEFLTLWTGRRRWVRRPLTYRGGPPLVSKGGVAWTPSRTTQLKTSPTPHSHTVPPTSTG